MTDIREKTGIQVIELLRYLINGSVLPFSSEDIDWKELCMLATEHHITNMIYYAVTKSGISVPNNVMDFLNQEHFKSVMRDVRQQAEIELIINELGKNHIRSLPLKGYTMKKYYPSTDMRFMSDLDILVDIERLSDVRNILESIGYTFVFCGKVHDNYEKKPIMHIEVHKCLMDDDVKDIAEYYNSSDWFSKAENFSDNSYLYGFSDDDFYIYMIAHLAKHFFTFGTGIRSVTDVYIYLKEKGKSLNWDYINTELKKMRLTKLNENIIALSKVWFDGEASTSVLSEISSYVISSGSYGKSENGVMHDFLEMNKNTNSFFFKKLKYTVFMIFPNVEYIAGKYSSIKKRPYLLPAYWIVRWFDSLFNNRKSIRLRLLGVIKTKDDVLNIHSDVKDE